MSTQFPVEISKVWQCLGFRQYKLTEVPRYIDEEHVVHERRTSPLVRCAHVLMCCFHSIVSFARVLINR